MHSLSFTMLVLLYGVNHVGGLFCAEKLKFVILIIDYIVSNSGFNNLNENSILIYARGQKKEDSEENCLREKALWTKVLQKIYQVE